MKQNSQNKKRIIKKLTSIVGVILSVFLISFSALASSQGSLSLNCLYHDKNGDIPMSGNTYAIIQIADAHKDSDNTLHYSTLEEFKQFDCQWGNCSSSELIKKAALLKEYVINNDYPLISAKTNNNGYITFDNIDEGLYLVFRLEADSSNKKYINAPMLISIPQIIGNDINYDVVAYPKFALKSDHTPTPFESNDEKLAKTGQLNWPIPLLIGAGIALVSIGLFAKSKEDEDEK